MRLNMKLNESKDEPRKCSTHFMFHAYARPSTRELFMVNAISLDCIGFDYDNEYEKWFEHDVFDFIEEKGLVRLVCEVQVAFSYDDYHMEHDYDYAVANLRIDKCKSFGQLKNAWKHIKEVEGL